MTILPTVVVRGTLGTGTECRKLTTDSGLIYSLTGNLGGHADGVYVEVTGHFVEISFCMAGKTIAVTHIAKTKKSASKDVPVFSIDTLDVEVMLAFLPMYGIHVRGWVNSGGWSNPRLVLETVGHPADGIYDFRFAADPPSGNSSDQMVPVLASFLFSPGRAINGIRVHAANNMKSWSAHRQQGLRAGDGDVFPHLMAKGDGDPFPLFRGDGDWSPFPFSASHRFTKGGSVTARDGDWVPFPLKSLSGQSHVGMTLRVYHTGDMLTMDYRTDRLNVELGRDERIVGIWVG